MDRKPRQLSGGQRQRVAMGRSIVRDPDVFLFDEPLSNLDAKLRVQMRSEIKALHRRLRTTVIYVTHDQTEALTMGDRIVVLNGGRIEQVGTPMKLYASPASLFVAEFIGSPKMNVLRGALAEEHGAALIGVRPEHCALSLDAGLWSGTATVSECLGSDTFVTVEVDGAGPVVVRESGILSIAPGTRVRVNPYPDMIHRFDAGGLAMAKEPAPAVA
jgi:multiple sugar transport system ATP-binding protein